MRCSVPSIELYVALLPLLKPALASVRAVAVWPLDLSTLRAAQQRAGAPAEVCSLLRAP